MKVFLKQKILFRCDLWVQEVFCDLDKLKFKRFSVWEKLYSKVENFKKESDLNINEKYIKNNKISAEIFIGKEEFLV